MPEYTRRLVDCGWSRMVGKATTLRGVVIYGWSYHVALHELWAVLGLPRFTNGWLFGSMVSDVISLFPPPPQATERGDGRLGSSELAGGVRSPRRRNFASGRMVEPS